MLHNVTSRDQLKDTVIVVSSSLVLPFVSIHCLGSSDDPCMLLLKYHNITANTCGSGDTTQSS